MISEKADSFTLKPMTEAKCLMRFAYQAYMNSAIY